MSLLIKYGVDYLPENCAECIGICKTIEGRSQCRFMQASFGESPFSGRQDFCPLREVEIVLCEDCKYYEPPDGKEFGSCLRSNLHEPYPNDFCHWGEARKDNQWQGK